MVVSVRQSTQVSERKVGTVASSFSLLFCPGGILESDCQVRGWTQKGMEVERGGGMDQFGWPRKQGYVLDIGLPSVFGRVAERRHTLFWLLRLLTSLYPWSCRGFLGSTPTKNGVACSPLWSEYEAAEMTCRKKHCTTTPKIRTIFIIIHLGDRWQEKAKERKSTLLNPESAVAVNPNINITNLCLTLRNQFVAPLFLFL